MATNDRGISKRGGYRPGVGKPTALVQGKTIIIRIPEKYKEHVIKYVKSLAHSESSDVFF